MKTIITDRYGDTLTIEQEGGVKSASIKEESVGEGTVLLTNDQCVQAAEGFLKLAGRSVVPVASLKLGGEISFNEAVLRVAALHKRTVTFRYAKDGGEYIEARRLNPERIVGEGEKLAAVGTDPDREDFRRYRLDRIKGEVAFA